MTVCDWRPSSCNENNIPDADHYIIGFPNEIMGQLSLNKNDYVIIMTHNFLRDKEILSYVTNQELYYVGIMGSSKRTQKLFNNEIPNFIHNPVGLSIGAKGPYEIAISIIAEIIKIKRIKGIV